MAAASLGSGTGLSLIAYTSSVFAPHLVEEFGWTRSQFALVGLMMFATVLTLPVIGRLTDRHGVKIIAIAGTVLLPLIFLVFSQMSGSFLVFLALSGLLLTVGSMTSPLVYTRLIAENFVKTQGLALTIMNCTPAVIAMGAVPLLNYIIVTWGWRWAYGVFGAFVFVCGAIAIMLIPPRKKMHVELQPGSPEPDYPAVNEPIRPVKEDYGIILRSRTFWIIIVAMFLAMLQTPLHASQMNIMLFDQVKSTQIAANIVSVYAFGTIVGRVLCGLALDRFSTPIVAAVSMGVPALGFLVLASSFDAVWVVTASMFFVGVSVGSESDLISFLAARYFKLRIYNSTLSLFQSGAFLASATGAGLTSLTLKLTDSYVPYLYFVTVTITIGSILFLLMPKAQDEKVG
ncbi:MAG: MFS transporter [Novosphingobium sp.]|nr:MFS transporter [Novosphingobium sp.]